MITGPPDTIRRARKLRSELSLPERVLVKELRKRPGGHKFRPQHGAGDYVLDFFCAKARLDIEIDGFAHDGKQAEKRDKRRSHYLRSQGIATTRIPAAKVLNELEGVVLRIVEICNAPVAELAAKRGVPLHHRPDGPPPRSGEDYL